ncbi:MAG: DUF3179 domain-containing protein [Gemmatimonadetes bacterium]|nr:DUF3179 domain-containing protein [Gemmatimonadota bacterium]MYG24341.1 DUF3179 domain-containing protein [Gemmatimonadota bacterium]MYJ39119.1 DUF3179 domain-containing protein [Gemmatimonadota bacterium]
MTGPVATMFALHVGTAQSHRAAPWCVLSTLLLVGCDGAGGIGTGLIPDDDLVCDLDPAFLADGGVGRDGIPALTDPEIVPISPMIPANSFVRDHDRVIAVQLGADWIVIPHNIMWRHEIVNFNGDDRMVVTYCPLTGSALAFRRNAVGGAEMRVSGLLYNANLVMYDTNVPESFWLQMLGEARCGPQTGTRLERLPAVEMTMAGWRSLHPDSRMVGAPGGFSDWRLYVRNPYGDEYEDPHNADFLDHPIPLDDGRLPPKERVLGLPGGPPGTPAQAFSFGAMASLGDHAALEFTYRDAPGMVIWDGTREAAMAYRPEVGAQAANFVAGEGGVVDDLTGTTWAVDGTPVAGPLAGTRRRLRPIADAYVAFWAAWAAFHPGTELMPGGT